MSSGKLTPLGVNVTAGQLQNIGFYINPVAASYMGSSRVNSEYNFGKIINDTYLKPLVYAINDAYKRSIEVGGSVLSSATDCTIDGDTLTVPATSTITGTIPVGSIITGNGVYPNTKIISQVTGNIGGSGTYVVDTFQYIKSGITMSATGIIPEWHNVTNTAWGSFLNTYAIWSGTNTEITARSYNALVSFPKAGTYTFTVQADDYLIVNLDYETPVYIGYTGLATNEAKTIKLRVKNGIHTISMIVTNVKGAGGGAIRITDSGGTEIWNTRSYLPITAVNGPTVSNVNYDALVSIGKDVMPILGDSPPNTYLNYDPANKWGGQATTGYYLTEDTAPAQGQSQTATWIPYNITNTNVGVTQWGYYRLFPLQAWNEFNWNGDPLGTDMPEYKDFASSFLTADTFVKFVNTGINSFKEAPDFLKGVYSNMNDLISSDITGVSLATRTFGADCIALGRAINLSKIETFGLPSVLLQIIKKNKILTQALSFALLSAGLSSNDINDISNDNMNPVPKEKEQKIYGAFLIIVGKDLDEILFALNCKTPGLETLADLLNIKKMFPNSYRTLTVPIYNATPGPTNSKTYYPIFTYEAVNVRIQSPQVVSQVGEQTPPGPPPVIEPVPIPPSPAQVIQEVVVAAAVAAGASNSPLGTGVGGGCVALESYIPQVELEQKHNGRDITQAWMLEPKFNISLGNRDLSTSIGKVTNALIDYQPCVKIKTETGVSLICSTTAKIATTEGFELSTNLLFKQVAVMRHNETYYDKVIYIEDVGMKFVRVIDTGDNSFWAGEYKDFYILHHNVEISTSRYINKD